MAEEPAVVYDVTEPRTHAQHAAEARDFADREDALVRLTDTAHANGDTVLRDRYELAAARCGTRAQWHATMAVYEALILPGYGMSVGDQLEHERETQGR